MRHEILRAAAKKRSGGDVVDPHWNNVVSLLPLESDLVDAKLGSGKWAAGGTGGVTFETKGGKLCARPAANSAYIHIPVSGDRAAFEINGDAAWTAEIEVWMDASYGTSIPTFFSIGDGESSGLHVWASGSGDKINVDTGTVDIAGHAGTIAPGQWYKLAASYDGANLYTHINGINNRTTPTTSFANPLSTNLVCIGYFGQVFTPSNMWFREFRFTEGVCRYDSTNYTPEDTFPRQGEPAYATWNPADKDADYTITNFNRTITRTAGADLTSFRSTLPKFSGKWYFEITYPNGTLNGDGGVGLASARTPVISSYPGGVADSVQILTRDPTRYVLARFSSVAPVTNLSGEVGEVMSMAIDMDARKAWVGSNGAWLIGDPVAGTDPLFTWAASFPICISMWIYYPDYPCIINAGQDAFAYPVPAGFNEGWFQ